MQTFSYLKYFQLSYFSRPASDRVLYRTIRRRKVRKILEIGIGTAARAVRMVDLARRFGQGETVRYAAIDLFEARAPEMGPILPLKEAHRVLKSTSAQVQLIPGDPSSALARAANALQNLDLVVISAEHDDPSLAGAWFYLPRMLHEHTVVYRESRSADAAVTTLTMLARAEIDERAEANSRRRAA